MKFYTHPQRKLTLIQRKDGRTYEKSWVYFRTLLRTENDEKSFPCRQTQQSLIFTQNASNSAISNKINNVSIEVTLGFCLFI